MIPSKKQKSDVWKFFSKGENNICVCQLCGKEYKSGGGTTNLKNHIVHKHGEVYPGAKKARRNAPAVKTEIEESDNRIKFESFEDDHTNQNTENIPFEVSETTLVSTPLTTLLKSPFSPSTSYTQPTAKHVLQEKESCEVTNEASIAICKDNLSVLDSTEKGRFQVSSWDSSQNVKTKQKSDVWRFFSRGTNNICICHLCGKQYKSGGGTTNLKNHIMHKHEHIYPKKVKRTKAGVKMLENCAKAEATFDFVTIKTEIEESDCIKSDDFEDVQNSRDSGNIPQSPSTVPFKSEILYSPEPTTTSTSLPHNTGQAMEQILQENESFEDEGMNGASSTQALLYMICKDNLPIDCTKREGMKHFLKTVVPSYRPPNRHVIWKLLERKYKSLQDILKRKLSSITNTALTANVATTSNGTRNFLALTLHFIDEENSTISALCLGVKQLRPQHTSNDTCKDISEMLDVWQIERRTIAAVTTDADGNMVRKLLEGLDGHIPCFTHSIELVVSKAFGDENITEIVAIIAKVKNVVSYFKQSNRAQEDLSKETDLNLQEVATGWNSTFYCLQRFKLLSRLVGKILLLPHHSKAPAMPTPLELSIIDEYLLVLKPFEAATLEISKERYISASLVIPLTNCIKTALERTLVSNELSKKLKSNLLREIESELYPLEDNLFLSVAAVLDPRFKKLHFQSYQNAVAAINKIKSEVEEVLSIQGFASSQVEVEQTALSSSIWMVHEEMAAKQSNSRDEGLPTELNLYLKQGVLSRDSNPIQYWIDMKGGFPAMFQVAVKYLTIQGVSVAAGRVASSLDNVCRDQTDCLTPNQINQLEFLRSLDKAYWSL